MIDVTDMNRGQYKSFWCAFDNSYIASNNANVREAFRAIVVISKPRAQNGIARSEESKVRLPDDEILYWLSALSGLKPLL